ncbi:hypothetical protein BN871_BS_00260 [Paenibacillus sp. P22]|nr:hypothetical protein BN871_BS_00260 [Paenibacillus sp. P22]
MVLLGESHFDVLEVSRRHADDLLLKAWDEGVGAQLERVTLGLSAFESLSVDEAFEIDDGYVAVLGSAFFNDNELGMALLEAIQLRAQLFFGYFGIGRRNFDAFVIAKLHFGLDGYFCLEFEGFALGELLDVDLRTVNRLYARFLEGIGIRRRKQDVDRVLVEALHAEAGFEHAPRYFAFAEARNVHAAYDFLECLVERVLDLLRSDFNVDRDDVRFYFLPSSCHLCCPLQKIGALRRIYTCNKPLHYNESAHRLQEKSAFAVSFLQIRYLAQGAASLLVAESELSGNAVCMPDLVLIRGPVYSQQKGKVKRRRMAVDCGLFLAQHALVGRAAVKVLQALLPQLAGEMRKRRIRRLGDSLHPLHDAPHRNGVVLQSERGAFNLQLDPLAETLQPHGPGHASALQALQSLVLDDGMKLLFLQPAENRVVDLGASQMSRPLQREQLLVEHRVVLHDIQNLLHVGFVLIPARQRSLAKLFLVGILLLPVPRIGKCRFQPGQKIFPFLIVALLAARLQQELEQPLGLSILLGFEHPRQLLLIVIERPGQQIDIMFFLLAGKIVGSRNGTTALLSLTPIIHQITRQL